MINNIYIVASKLSGHNDQMKIIADNVANVNTNGFKKLVMDFEENAARKLGQAVGSFTKDSGIRVNYSEGTYSHTGNPFDVALQGEAFFGIEKDGKTFYTRDGQFSLDAQGLLVNSNGDPVVDQNGGQITIPADATEVLITDDGMVSSKNGEIAKIGVFQFEEADMQKLQRVGFGLFNAPTGADPTPPEVGTYAVLQGKVESSNVNPIEEVTNMIEVSRAYQSALRLVQRMEEVDQRGVRDLARMPS